MRFTTLVLFLISCCLDAAEHSYSVASSGSCCQCLCEWIQEQGFSSAIVAAVCRDGLVASELYEVLGLSQDQQQEFCTWFDIPEDDLLRLRAVPWNDRCPCDSARLPSPVRSSQFSDFVADSCDIPGVSDGNLLQPHSDDAGGGFCSWSIRQTSSCLPSPERPVGTAERALYDWEPPTLDTSVAEEDEESRDWAAECSRKGLEAREGAPGRIVEVMLYHREADHLLVKLWEYGDLLHRLVVVEGRSSFTFVEKPRGFAHVRRHFARWSGVLDHGTVDCYAGSEHHLNASAGAAVEEATVWANEHFSRAAGLRRAGQLGLDEDDVVVISDADEVLTRETAQLLRHCRIPHGPVRLEMDMMWNRLSCRLAEDWFSVTALTWATVEAMGEDVVSALRVAQTEGKTALAALLVQSGWHYSSFFSAAGLREKSQFSPHQGQTLARGDGGADILPCRSPLYRVQDPFALALPRILRDNLRYFAHRGWLLPFEGLDKRVSAALFAEPDGEARG